MVSGSRGRHRCDDLRRKHRRDGRHQNLFTAIFLVAAVIAVVLGFGPKFGI